MKYPEREIETEADRIFTHIKINKVEKLRDWMSQFFAIWFCLSPARVICLCLAYSSAFGWENLSCQMVLLIVMVIAVAKKALSSASPNQSNKAEDTHEGGRVCVCVCHVKISPVFRLWRKTNCSAQKYRKLQPNFCVRQFARNDYPENQVDEWQAKTAKVVPIFSFARLRTHQFIRWF